jgi:hypothetical protein
MNTLAQLQQALQSHVLHGDVAIAAAIDESAEIPAAVRLGVYSDAYRLRLIEALDANFPVLAKLLGADVFARMTQQYLLAHPSRHFSIRWFGDRLAVFLASFPDYVEQPWLKELAEWEWKTAAAFDASDAAVVTVAEMASVAPEQWGTLQFIPHPSVRRITLTTNVVAMVKAANTDNELPKPLPSNATSEWLIWRRDLMVQFRSLAAAEAVAFETLLSGATFEEICDALAEHCDVDDVPLQVASYLKTWLTEGWIASFNARLER